MKKSMFFWNFIVLAGDSVYLDISVIPVPNVIPVEMQGAKDLVPVKVKEADLNDFCAGHKL
jgi:hypothetical protein